MLTFLHAAEMRVWCRDGIKLYENETQHLFVDHPSVSALKNERKRLEKEIHRGISNFKEGESHKEVHWKDREPNPDLSLPFRNKALEAEKLLHDIKMFINEDSQYLGHVIAGSGFGEHMERATGSEDRKERWDINVDWALVDIADGRRPTNAVSACQSYGSHMVLTSAAWLRLCATDSPGQKPRSLKPPSLHARTWVWSPHRG